MSAIPIIAPRPAPSPASSATPPSPVDQRADSATFNAHLQDVRHRQSQASDTADGRTASAQSSPANAASMASASTSANGKADPTTDDEDADADSSVPAATQVLGLIQQSSGDAAAPTAASTDGKSAAKTAPQGDEVRPGQPAVTGMPMPAPMPSPVSSSQTAASSNDSGTPTSATSLSITAAVAPMPGKATGAFSATDDAGDDAGDDNSDSAIVPAASTDASAQPSINSLFGNAHNAPAAAADAATPVAGPAQDTGDLATLRGALATPVLIASTSSSPAPHSLNISANVTSPTFSQELGQQVSWLGGQEVKQAQIRLNPQELGPLDVKVSVEHGRVDVVFAAQHPATVAAVQQSLQQLTQMLGGQGLSLGQASVGQHMAQQQFDHSQRHASSTPAQTNDVEPIDTAVSPLSAPLAIGLVDAFA